MARKREINRLVVKWRDRLWLGQWLISTELVKEIEPPDGSAYDTTARTKYQSDYRKAHIQVATSIWDKRSQQAKNRTICHEMVHVALSPRDDFIDGLLKEVPPAKRAVYTKWHDSLLEAEAEHLCNVLLDASGELK